MDWLNILETYGVPLVVACAFWAFIQKRTHFIENELQKELRESFARQEMIVIKLIDQIGYGTNLYGEEYEQYQRIMLLLGWNHWNFYNKPPKAGIVNYMKNIGEKRDFEKLSKEKQEMIKKILKDLE